jgi:hypothetical protein
MHPTSRKFENRLLGPTILLNEFSQIISRVVRRVPPTMWPQSKHIAKTALSIPCFVTFLVPIPKIKR